MSSSENVEKMIENAKIRTNPQVNKAVLNGLIEQMGKSGNANTKTHQNNLWRIIMTSKTTRFATAAFIIVAVLIGINFFGGSIDGANVAWGEVVKRIADVEYLHYYEITNPKDGFPNIREGWYSNGKLKERSCGGYGSYGAFQSFDDGKTVHTYDRHNNITHFGKSDNAKYNNIFEALAYGEVSIDYSNFMDKTPAQSGTDFLIYNFDPPAEADWIEKISVTVGRNSLVPLQIKTYYKNLRWYGISHLFIFDYEEAQKPVDFFDPPTEIKPPHGIGHLVLGGEEVEIEVHDAPGVKKAIVRLHTKFDGEAKDLLIPYRERYKIEGKPMYFMEVTFITDEGYRSNTMKSCPLWIDKGVKAALGKPEIWPDKKNRNIRFTPVLRETDKDDEFLLELSCWLRIRETEL